MNSISTVTFSYLSSTDSDNFKDLSIMSELLKNTHATICREPENYFKL
jgi:hypothetical protein